MKRDYEREYCIEYNRKYGDNFCRKLIEGDNLPLLADIIQRNMKLENCMIEWGISDGESQQAVFAAQRVLRHRAAND